MFDMVRKILSYLNWFGLVAFFVVAAVIAYPVKAIVGVAFFVIAALLLIVTIGKCSNKYSPEQRVGGGKPVGDLIFDVLILGGSVALYGEMAGQWFPLFVTGIVLVGIDFVLQLLYRYGAKAQKCRA